MALFGKKQSEVTVTKIMSGIGATTVGTLGVTSQQQIFTTNNTLNSMGYYTRQPLTVSSTGLGAYYPSAAVPPMTGQKQTISFTCADGFLVAISVDLAHIPYMQAISNANANYYSQIQTYFGAMNSTPLTPARSSPMVEGDFSMEEMEKALDIIEELNADQPSA